MKSKVSLVLLAIAICLSIVYLCVFQNDFIHGSFLWIIVFICCVSLLTILQQRKESNLLIQRLEASNLDLEAHVAVRTQELETSNEELRQSMEEIQTLHQDIDLRNEHLEELLQEMQLLYDYAPCGYHSVDPNGTIIKINQTELDWVGYTKEEVVGKKNVSHFLTKESLEERKKYIETLKETGHLENLEFDFVRKDGSTFPVLLNTVVYRDREGNYLKHRSTVFDISQRKKLEEQLKEANTLPYPFECGENRFLAWSPMI